MVSRHETFEKHTRFIVQKEDGMSLLEEARELVEMSLKADVEQDEYARKARVWLEKTAEAQKSHADHDHGDGASCSLCGFDLACPSCGH